MSDAYAAIANLIALYAERIDGGDIEGVGDLFADAEVSSSAMGTSWRGRQAAIDFYRSVLQLYEDGTPRTKHVTTNLLIEIDDAAGTATCRSYFTVLQEVPGSGRLQPITAGRYHDEFAEHDGSWRFTRRLIIRELDGDLSEHMLRR